MTKTRTTTKDLVEAINAYLLDRQITESEAQADTPISDLGINPDVSLAQTLQDCGVVHRPDEELEHAQLKAMESCWTFGDLLAWCNNEKAA